METPHFDHLTINDYKYVYEPAQDSFLLLDALEADLTYLKELQPRVCLEIGPGSGVIITALSKALASTICLAADINPYACEASKRTAQRNSTVIDVVQGNLADALRPRIVDLLVFNPPYVVTEDDEIKEGFTTKQAITEQNLIKSWAGGHHGRRIIDELITKLDDILSTNGVFYLLLLRENKPDEIIERLGTLKFNAIKIMERRIPGEYLYILKIRRISCDDDEILSE